MILNRSQKKLPLLFLFFYVCFTSNIYASEKTFVLINKNGDNTYIKAKQIIGTSEEVVINPGNIHLEAKIDTGASTTSLHAENLQIINENGKKWATFLLEGKLQKHKIIDYVDIKQHHRASQRRPVIQLNITLGNISQTIKVTLTNRSNFSYKALIGVNFLYDYFVVDVSQKNLTKKK
jgi:hypothetical protein